MAFYNRRVSLGGGFSKVYKSALTAKQTLSASTEQQSVKDATAPLTNKDCQMSTPSKLSSPPKRFSEQAPPLSSPLVLHHNKENVCMTSPTSLPAKSATTTPLSLQDVGASTKSPLKEETKILPPLMSFAVDNVQLTGLQVKDKLREYTKDAVRENMLAIAKVLLASMKKEKGDSAC